MVLASSCCENGFACSTQPRNPQGRLLQVETEKTLANLAIKYELCQKQQLKNYSHELYERMVVILSHVRRLKNPVKWQQCKRGLTDKEISVLENLVSKLVDDEPGPARASLPSTLQRDKSHTDTHQPDDPANCNDSSQEEMEWNTPKKCSSQGSIDKVPTSKDAIKKMWETTAAIPAILKKPAANKKDTQGSGIGMKLVFAKQQSYIQTKDPVDGKWKLLVAVSEKQSPDHKTIIEMIRQEKPKNKKLAVKLRNFLLSD